MKSKVIEVVVDGDLASAVAAGAPVVQLRDASGPTPAEGGPVRIVSPARKFLAHGVGDPGRARIHTVAGAGDEDLATALEAAVDRAVGLRERLFVDPSTDAYCLFHGPGDGAAGLVAERFGEFAVLYVYSRALWKISERFGRILMKRAGLAGVVRKMRLKGKDRTDEVQEAAIGQPVPGQLVVAEDGIPYEVHLERSLNVGLFTDMREVRRAVGRGVGPGISFLNLFAYTGAFSVVAARAGASVTSVDISSGVLSWAEDNFRLSGLDPTEHEFTVQDALSFLKVADRRDHVFDTILLDPPAFSESRRGGWVYKRDFPLLLRLAIGRLSPGGLLWAATNMRTLRPGTLDKWIGQAAAGNRRRVDVLAVDGLPLDRPTPLAAPEERYLEVYCLRAD